MLATCKVKCFWILAFHLARIGVSSTIAVTTPSPHQSSLSSTAKVNNADKNTITNAITASPVGAVTPNQLSVASRAGIAIALLVCVFLLFFMIWCIPYLCRRKRPNKITPVEQDQRPLDEVVDDESKNNSNSNNRDVTIKAIESKKAGIREFESRTLCNDGTNDGNAYPHKKATAHAATQDSPKKRRDSTDSEQLAVLVPAKNISDSAARKRKNSKVAPLTEELNTAKPVSDTEPDFRTGSASENGHDISLHNASENGHDISLHNASESDLSIRLHNESENGHGIRTGSTSDSEHDIRSGSASEGERDMRSGSASEDEHGQAPRQKLKKTKRKRRAKGAPRSPVADSSSSRHTKNKHKHHHHHHHKSSKMQRHSSYKIQSVHGE